MSGRPSGRPLRCFGLLLVGWVGVRIAQQPDEPLLPSNEIILASNPAPSLVTPIAMASSLHQNIEPSQGVDPTLRTMSTSFAVLHTAIIDTNFTPRKPPAASGQDETIEFLKFINFAVAFANRHNTPDEEDISATPAAIPTPISQTDIAKAPDRLRGSGWVLWRPGNATQPDIATVGRLGGSQAGLRLDYELAPGAQHRAAAYARATSALNNPAAPEAALGLAMQPIGKLPITLAVERRIALGKDARNAMAVMAVGGFGPTPVAQGIEAEAYAQAGMVGFRRRDAFVDGKLSLFSPISKTPLRIGAAVSGGAQPGVKRLDIGPEVQVRLPIPSAAARLSVEWRERIAGRATPASGVAITLATDF